MRLLLSLVLSLWVAGAGCLLGCERMNASASTEPVAANLIVSGDACASSETHDCCAKKRQAHHQPEQSPDDPILNSSNSSNFTGCPLAVGRSVVVSKNFNGDSDVAVQTIRPVAPLEAFKQVPAQFSNLPVPNRGHTYLRCCVFLI